MEESELCCRLCRKCFDRKELRDRHSKRCMRNFDKPRRSKQSDASISTVLALRGDQVCKQPLIHGDSSSTLCWNGEAWKIDGRRVTGNDSSQVFQLLLDAAGPSSDTSTAAPSTSIDSQYIDRIRAALSRVSGPFAFVFYDAHRSCVFYGRDILGRRSLLRGLNDARNFKLCSVCDGSATSFEEVPTDGFYMIDIPKLRSDLEVGNASLEHYSMLIPWCADADASSPSAPPNTLPPMNKESPPNGIPPPLTIDSSPIEKLMSSLSSSVDLRVRGIPEPPNMSSENDAKVAVLFSGGLDCSILARLAHEIVPENASIDLLNVAFENPRVTAAAAANASKLKRGKADAASDTAVESPKSAYESCPDRITGRSSYAELCRVCPGRRFNFVAINVPYTETLAHRNEIIRLMRPHDTEMDLSIACAFYFAARGQGMITLDDCNSDEKHEVPYTTSARVLLSGLGADELFGGYTRHGTAYRRQGFPGLIAELELDVTRLGKRNLGRDDRVLSHWGREARYPFLDEDFLFWVLGLPVWQKTGFGQENVDASSEEGSLDAEKKALRLLAWRLGLRRAAGEKKRAIQFGSRTAKMESGRSKGDQRLAI
ncbi:hypothetical protein KEM56_002891 [Ascosphaera pollenicola]|nr:hypothetical protein KEM56_002891 [Ascosphaera pollenicola]